MTSKAGAQPKKVASVQPAADKDAAPLQASRFIYNQSDSASSQQGAGALQTMLAQEFADKPHEETVAPQPKPKRFGQPLSPVRSRILKTIAGLVILLSVGWMPLQRLFQVSSVEAVVNAQIVTLRAPIGGVIADGLEGLRVGSSVPAGWLLATVTNARADHGAIERAMEDLETTREDQGALASRISHLAELRGQVSQRVEAYRIDRKSRVAAEMAEIDAQLVGPKRCCRGPRPSSSASCR